MNYFFNIHYTCFLSFPLSYVSLSPVELFILQNVSQTYLETTFLCNENFSIKNLVFSQISTKLYEQSSQTCTHLHIYVPHSQFFILRHLKDYYRKFHEFSFPTCTSQYEGNGLYKDPDGSVVTYLVCPFKLST